MSTAELFDQLERGHHVTLRVNRMVADDIEGTVDARPGFDMRFLKYG